LAEEDSRGPRRSPARPPTKERRLIRGRYAKNRKSGGCNRASSGAVAELQDLVHPHDWSLRLCGTHKEKDATLERIRDWRPVHPLSSYPPRHDVLCGGTRWRYQAPALRRSCEKEQKLVEPQHVAGPRRDQRGPEPAVTPVLAPSFPTVAGIAPSCSEQPGPRPVSPSSHSLRHDPRELGCLQRRSAVLPLAISGKNVRI
jgi:hypothetical protein